MPRVVVISGPIGAGKTAVARALVAAPGTPTVAIEGDKFWPFIIKGLGVRNQDFRASMRAMTGAALAYARTGFDVVLDFSMPPPFIAGVKARATQAELHYVILRPSLAVCAARAAARQEGAILDYREYEKFYALFDTDARHIIADDDSDPETLARQIEAGVAAGTFRL